MFASVQVERLGDFRELTELSRGCEEPNLRFGTEHWLSLTAIGQQEHANKRYGVIFVPTSQADAVLIVLGVGHHISYEDSNY